MKKLVVIFVFLRLALADIRVDNNELTAQGQWKVKYNPNSTQQAELKAQPAEIEEPSKKYSQQISGQDVKINVFDHLRGSGGSCFGFFYDSDLRDSFQNHQKVDSLSIRFHDSKYIDQKILVLKIPLHNYIIDRDQWQNKNTRINYTYFQELELRNHGTVQVSFRVGHQNIELYLGDYQVSIQYSKKQYSIVFPISILAFNLLLLYLAIRFERREIVVQKISIISLYHNIFFFIYLSTFFMIVGMSALPEPMSILLICGCLQILISVKLIRKFETIIQRISNINGYCIFYCGIFIYVWFIFNYFYTPAFILINSLFLLPQIIHNVRFGNKLGKEYEYLIILVSPQLYFIYLKGYSDNLLRYHPQPYVCAGVIVLIALQVWVVLSQNRKGPYYFINKRWLPNYFDYYQTFKLDSKSDLYQQQCSICLCSLAEQDPMSACQKNEKTEQQLKSKNDFSAKNQVILIVTPCKHKFHPKCLQEWIQYKRQCPVDRSPLPILYK